MLLTVVTLLARRYDNGSVLDGKERSRKEVSPVLVSIASWHREGNDASDIFLPSLMRKSNQTKVHFASISTLRPFSL